MNLSQFELLCEVARVKSFSKAAKLLHLSQPAVSAQISSIEDFYGTQLFERSSSGVTLTEVGKVVYDYAKEILKIHEALEKEVDGLLRTENQKLVIGASSNIGNYALPCSIWTFKEKHPLAEVKQVINNAETILDMLRNDQIDVAIVEGNLSEYIEDLVFHKVSNDELLVIAPPQKPWLNRTTITLEELKKAPLIIREKGSGIRRVFEEAIGSWGLQLDDMNVKTEMGSINAIKSTVEAGLGISVCSRVACQKAFRAGLLHPLTIEGKSIKIDYLIVHKPKKSLNITVKRFIRFIIGPGDPLFC